jgi:glycosyltransferase involved in cell wall biosynthesis
MVTPHLPPDLAANALLPQLLGNGLVARGHQVSFVAFRPRHGEPARPSSQSGQSDVFYIDRPAAHGWRKNLKLSQLSTAVEVFVKARKPIALADVVHVHSNTFMNQVSAALSSWRGRPFILTHYGTEIWHFRRKRPVDPFLWMNRRAAHVTYYSRRLLERSIELGVEPANRSVVYPPVDRAFRVVEAEEREKTRRELGADSGPLILNVKRLHPLAGQRYMIEGMPEILQKCPSAKLWIAGEGESRAELEALIAEKGLARAVKLLGQVDNRKLPAYYTAADLFVLPSVLEAFPTVAAESLASGTPVVSAEHPGGTELKELFPDDVRLVPLRDPAALAREVLAAVFAPRRTTAETLEQIEERFRPETALETYLSLYKEAAGS